VAAVLAAVVLFSAALYLPSARYGFVWDDNTLIANNSLLAHSRPAEIFSRGFWAGSPEQSIEPGSSYYRPLVTLSFWLDLHLSQANPHWFHVVNLLLYALAAVAVTLVLWELLHSGVWALLGGLLFAAHSSHVESVAFVSGRTDIMLTLFVGLAAFALLRSFRKHNRWWWFLVLAAFNCALLSKETAVLFPLLVALAPLLVGLRYDRRYWLLVLATLAVLAGYLLLRASAVPVPVPFAGRGGLLIRLAAVVNAFGLYVRMFFWPFTHRALYLARDTSLITLPNITAALLLVGSAVLLALRRRFLATLWGYAWAVAFLLPVVGTVSTDPLLAERLLCLPSAGLVMVLVTALSRVPAFPAAARRLVVVGLGVVIILLGADTIARTRIWRDNETFYTTMAHEAPNAPDGYANLADAIAGRQPDSALALYRHALSLDPDDIIVLNNLALAFRDAGEFDSALVMIDRAIATQPSGSAVLYLNRASVLITAGRTAEAEADLRRALEQDSTLSGARTMLAGLLNQQGQYDSAIAVMQGEVRYRPSVENFTYLGDLFMSAGDSGRAGQSYNQALRLDPTYVPALYNQSVLFAARGDLTAARILAERAYQLRPNHEPIRQLYLRLNQSPGPNP
jgi:tetratricopeptide (TPR) repeat protein